MKPSYFKKRKIDGRKMELGKRKQAFGTQLKARSLVHLVSENFEFIFKNCQTSDDVRRKEIKNEFRKHQSVDDQHRGAAGTSADGETERRLRCHQKGWCESSAGKAKSILISTVFHTLKYTLYTWKFFAGQNWFG